MDRYIFGYLWFLSLMGALLYGHTIGFIQGQDEAKANQGYKFEDVSRAFAGAKK